MIANLSPHDVIDLARLVLQLGAQNRITRDPDGRLESVTTHTVMLALVALLLAPEEATYLSMSRVVIYALVHDLPEALAGDTPTLRTLTSEERAEKDRREANAITEIHSMIPVLGSLIESYERQDTPEARFVHLLDKAMPKALHALDDGRMLCGQGVTPDDLLKILDEQQTRLEKDFREFPTAANLYQILGQLAFNALVVRRPT